MQDWAEGENLLRFQAIKFQREMDPGSSLILTETRQVMEGDRPTLFKAGPQRSWYIGVRPARGGRPV